MKTGLKDSGRQFIFPLGLITSKHRLSFLAANAAYTKAYPLLGLAGHEISLLFLLRIFLMGVFSIYVSDILGIQVSIPNHI